MANKNRPERSPSESSTEDLDVHPQQLQELQEELATLKKAYRVEQIRAEQYRGILDQQNALICCFQGDGTLTFVNSAYCLYFGRTERELIGRRFAPRIPLQDQARIEAEMASLSPASAERLIEHRVILDGHDVRRQRWRMKGLFDTQGHLQEIQAVGYDLATPAGHHATTAEPIIPEPSMPTPHTEDLEELGRFASHIAHDFNNLLVGILGNSGLALMDLSPFSPCRLLIQEVEKAAQRAAELSNQMLTYSGRFVASGMVRHTTLNSTFNPMGWRGEGTILVVDDEEMVCSLAQRVLEKIGFKVMIAEDGQYALEIFRAHAAEIRAVLLDMTMPELDGQTTFRELRRIRSDAVVVLSSGYNVEDALPNLMEMGLAGFLHKPYMPSDLIAILRQAIEGGNRSQQTEPNHES